MTMNKLLVGCFGIAFTSVAMSPVIADDYPVKPITAIVGFGAGGGTDNYARAVTSVAKEILGQPIQVVNKPGRAQVVAMKQMQKATPDGYTIQFASAGSAIMSTKLKPAGVEFLRDFEMVAQVGQINMAVVVNNEGSLKSAKDIIAAAKANPGKLRWAHTGRGSANHIAGLSWLIANGIKAQDVPFKGGAKARAAILGKQTDFAVFGVQLTNKFKDKLTPVGMLQGGRDGFRNEIPTMKEQNIAYVPVYTPLVISVPKGTPQSVVDKLNTGLKKMVEHPKVIKALTKRGSAIIYRNGTETRKVLESLDEQWQPIFDGLKEK